GPDREQKYKCQLCQKALLLATWEDSAEALRQVRRIEFLVLAQVDAAEGRTDRVLGLAGPLVRQLLRLLRPLGRVAGLTALAALLLPPALLLATAGATGHSAHSGHLRHAAATGHSAAAGHLSHHLLRLAEALHELIDRGDRGAGALGDAGAAGAVEDLRVRPLGRCHRSHNR